MTVGISAGESRQHHLPLPSGKIGIGEIITLVEQGDIEQLGTGIGKAVAKIEIGGMAHGFPVGRTCKKRPPSDFGGDGHLLCNNIFDEVVPPGRRIDSPSHKLRRDDQ
jgi:hypothetical protein